MGTTGSTKGQQPVGTGNGNAWKQVMVGGVSGIAIGTAATAAVAATMDYAQEEDADSQVSLDGVDGSAYIDGTIPVADSHDDMSFGEAFAAARLQVGPGGVFVWHGHVYGTYTAEEWNSMSEAEHAEFGSHMTIAYNEHDDASAQTVQTVPAADVTVEHTAEAHVAGGSHEPETRVEVNPEEPAVAATHPEEPVVAVVQHEEPLVQPAAPEVEVLDYNTITTEDGSSVDVAVVNVDGQEIGLYDVNQDGVADLAAQDLNNDQQITPDEVADISEAGISMLPLQEEYLAQNDPSGQEPDYINDGNVESYMA